MADLNDLTKPDLTSRYDTEVLQTLLGHIKRLWLGGDYTGLAGGIVAGLRRWYSYTTGTGSSAKQELRLYQRNASAGDDVIFDTANFARTDGSNLSPGAVGASQLADSVFSGLTPAPPAAGDFLPIASTANASAKRKVLVSDLLAIGRAYQSMTITADTALDANTEYTTGSNLTIAAGVNFTVPSTSALRISAYPTGRWL